MNTYITHTVRGQEFWLLPENALYWQSEQMLFIADLHLGKATHFRNNGMYFPEQIIGAELEKLTKILKKIPVKKVIIAGDLFHSKNNAEWQGLKEWILLFPDTKFILVKGNHDILPIEIYQQTALEVVPNHLIIGDFIVAHYPIELEENTEFKDYYRICGHLHPGFLLGAKMQRRLSLACFWFQEHQVVLPSFGVTTGKVNIKPNPSDKVFVVAGEKVILGF